MSMFSVVHLRRDPPSGVSRSNSNRVFLFLRRRPTAGSCCASARSGCAGRGRLDQGSCADALSSAPLWIAGHPVKRAFVPVGDRGARRSPPSWQRVVDVAADIISVLRHFDHPGPTVQFVTMLSRNSSRLALREQYGMLTGEMR